MFYLQGKYCFWQCHLICLYCLTSSSRSCIQLRAVARLLTLSIISPDNMASWSRYPKLPTTVLLRSSLGVLNCTESATLANGYTCKHDIKLWRWNHKILHVTTTLYHLPMVYKSSPLPWDPLNISVNM